MKDGLGEKTMTKFLELKAKTYSYLIDNGSKDKNATGTKKGVTKINIKFENYKSCLEATQFNTKINYQERKEINIDSFKTDHKEFIKTTN